MLFTIWLVIAIATACACILNISNQSFLGQVKKDEVVLSIVLGILWPIFIPFVIIARLMG